MAHTNDLNDARAAIGLVTDPIDKAQILADIASASALTDIAAALEKLSYTFRRK